MKRYIKGDSSVVRAQQIWLILTAHAVLKPVKMNEDEDAGWSGWGPGLITYGDLAKQMDMDKNAARCLAYPLGVIGYYCKDNDLPPLNAIVVNNATGEPGHGVVETDGVEEDQKKIWSEDWFSYYPPTIQTLQKILDRKYSHRPLYGHSDKSPSTDLDAR